MTEKKSIDRHAPMLAVSTDGAFGTVQGEGHTMGQLAVFLRLFGCNLRCAFCDSMYAVKPGAKFEWWSLDKALQEILAASNGGKRVVFTGGEPLLQQKKLRALSDMPPLDEWDVEIETDGTIIPHAFEDRKKVQINCSPKLTNSQEPKHKRIQPSVLTAIAHRFHSYFKFVVSGASDIREIEDTYMPLLAGVDRKRICISPEGVSVEQIDRGRADVADAVRQAGFTLGDRLHIRRFGNKRRT